MLDEQSGLLGVLLVESSYVTLTEAVVSACGLSPRLPAREPLGVDGDLIRWQSVVLSDLAHPLLAPSKGEEVAIRVSDDEVAHSGRTGGDGVHDVCPSLPVLRRASPDSRLFGFQRGVMVESRSQLGRPA